MSIKIEYVGDSKYTASVTPSKYRDVATSTNSPMGRLPLIDLLVELGYHQQDIGDAFYEAEPEWLQG